jgi:hypothetical protein
LDNTYLNSIIPIGKFMVEQNKLYIQNALKHVYIMLVNINKQYFLIGFVNTTILKSEIGHELIVNNDCINFAAVYSANVNNFSFSLRSDYNRTDVSKIALSYGGGGHRNASGLSYDKNYIGEKVNCNNILNTLSRIYFKTIKYDDIFFNMVCLNNIDNDYHIGKYLLQIRNIDKNENIIQECTYHNTKFTSKISMIEICCIWNYDGNANKTNVKMITMNDISKHNFSNQSSLSIKDIQEKYLSGYDVMNILSGLYSKCDNFVKYSDYISYELSGGVVI